MYVSSLRYAHHINEQFVFVTSLFVNSMLIRIVVNEKNEMLKAYSKVLLQNCIVDMFCTIVCYLTELQMEYPQGYMVYIVNSPFQSLPIEFHFVCVFFYVLAIAQAIHIVPIMFYFRYTLVCKGYLIKTSQLFKILIIPTIPALFEAFTSAMGFYSDSHSDPAEHAKQCRKLLNHSIWWENNTQIATAKCMYASNFNLYAICFMGMATFMDFTVYFVMIVCTVKVIQQLRLSKEKFSAKTQRLQNQMNIMLSIQMSLPIFTAVIPAAITMIFPFFKIDVPGIGIVSTMCFSWIPVISPSTTIYFVKNFRNKFIEYIVPNCCGKLKAKVNTNAVSTMNSIDNQMEAIA